MPSGIHQLLELVLILFVHLLPFIHRSYILKFERKIDNKRKDFVVVLV